MMRRALRCSGATLALVGLALGQGPAAAATPETRLAQWRELVVPFDPVLHWLPNGEGLVCAPRSGDGEWQRITRDGRRTVGRDRQAVGLSAAPVALEPLSVWRASGRSSTHTTITFTNGTERAARLFWSDASRRLRPYGELSPGAQRTLSTFVGHVWVTDFAPDELAGIFEATLSPGLATIDARSQEVAGAPAAAVAQRRAFVRDHDLWLRRDDGTELRLTEDGTAADGYVTPLRWSADGAKALAFRRVAAEVRKITLVESSPRDQLQPRTHTVDYPKPGDPIDAVRPCLVDVSGERILEVAAAPFTNAWSVDRVHWAEDGREVFVLHNQRGHQVLRVLGIDAASGKVRTVLEERSETFVDYSQKTFLHWLKGSGAFLWASERDGRNHLYRCDVASGALQQVTAGPWLVRGVERVDEETQQVWFTAYGIHPAQDPYFAHLARIGLDGRGLQVLTEANGTHEWTFSPDRSLFVDRWSRVDQPWVTELRRSSDGSLVAELGRDDAGRLLATGWRPPVPFVAKGRDGSTDIHGILIWPSRIAPERRYPIVEDIYAGPHGHFVPKRWGLGERQRRLAELGMVVVQIDGMGTNWRHRAFHDVCWRNLADAGLPDRILWLRAAAASNPQLDLERVGVFGGSAGGQSALAALLHHGDVYKVAVADCGCHDNRMDKIWWNEAWMGYPIGAWYEASSNVTHAHELQGKLLLTVGELDRNVDPASTMQVADALIRAGKDFELVVVPGGGHGVGETSYLVRRRAEFFAKWLGVDVR